MKPRSYWIISSLCAVSALVLGVFFLSSQQSISNIAQVTPTSSPTSTVTQVPQVGTLPATPSATLGTYTPPATVAPAPPSAPAALPVSISIPAIGVSSNLITLGLNTDGTLQVPSGQDYDKAGWYSGSSAPGEKGPAIIAGHVDSYENGPSVFFSLSKIQPGQIINITREDGSTVSFSVFKVEQYSKNNFPTREVYGNTQKPEIRLITCGGTFSSTSGHYTDNVVVYAS